MSEKVVAPYGKLSTVYGALRKVKLSSYNDVSLFAKMSEKVVAPYRKLSDRKNIDLCKHVTHSLANAMLIILRVNLCGKPLKKNSMGKHHL